MFQIFCIWTGFFCFLSIPSQSFPQQKLIKSVIIKNQECPGIHTFQTNFQLVYKESHTLIFSLYKQQSQGEINCLIKLEEVLWKSLKIWRTSSDHEANHTKSIITSIQDPGRLGTPSSSPMTGKYSPYNMIFHDLKKFLNQGLPHEKFLAVNRFLLPPWKNPSYPIED